MFLVKFHHLAPFTIDINLVFLEFLFLSLFEYALFVYWAFFTIYLWVELRLFFLKYFSVLYTLWYYSEGFSGLRPVVFVSLIGVSTLKIGVPLISYILFIFRLPEFLDCRRLSFSRFFQVGKILFLKHIFE